MSSLSVWFRGVVKRGSCFFEDHPPSEGKLRRQGVWNGISIDLPCVITGLIPSAVLSPAFNEITLRDKAVTPLKGGRGEQYLTMGWAKIKIHYTLSSLAKLLALFSLPLAEGYKHFAFFTVFSIFLKPSKSFSVVKTWQRLFKGPVKMRARASAIAYK